MEAPTNISELRGFLQMVNKMGNYLPNLAQTSRPLRDLLRKDTAWIWESTQKNAFKTIKRHLPLTPVLAIYDPQLQAKAIADASSYWSRNGPKAPRGYLEVSSIHIEGILKYRTERGVGHDVGMRETGRLFDQQNISHWNRPLTSCAASGHKESWWNAAKNPVIGNVSLSIRFHYFSCPL